MKYCNLLLHVLTAFIVIVGILMAVRNIDKHNASISTYSVVLPDSSLYSSKAINRILITK